MKHLQIFETYGNPLPSENEVYETVDEYFESINPHIMDQVEYDKYGHYAKYKRDKSNFKGAYLKLSDITDKPKDEVYTGLFSSLKSKGYDPDAYCPIVSDKEKKALDLADMINFKQPSYRDGEYGRAILIKCNSGKTLCFYFIPDEPKGWWPPTFAILRFDTDTDSIYWTKTSDYDKLVIVFWNGSEIAHGNFEILYEGHEENQYYTWESSECSRASDSMSYTASLKIPVGDTDVEDIELIHRN
jgi:hypothetical protein